MHFLRLNNFLLFVYKILIGKYYCNYVKNNLNSDATIADGWTPFHIAAQIGSTQFQIGKNLTESGKANRN